MSKALILAVFVGAAILPFAANAADDMSCSHFSGMKASGRMAAVESMETKMAASNKMDATATPSTAAMKPSDHMSASQMTKMVTATCKTHPDMMMGDAMHSAMGH